MEDGKIVGRFSEFVNPRIPIPFRIEKLTSINDSMVAGADSIDVILPRFVEFCRGAVMVAHNAEFDMSFIEKTAGIWGSRQITHLWTLWEWPVFCFPS